MQQCLCLQECGIDSGWLIPNSQAFSHFFSLHFVSIFEHYFLNSLKLVREVPIEPKEEPLTEETIIEGE